jgi:ABC-type amino acid transport system permease subunit
MRQRFAEMMRWSRRLFVIEEDGMEFVLMYLAVAVITTVALTFLAFVFGTVWTTVLREKGRVEAQRWHPSENLD